MTLNVSLHFFFTLESLVTYRAFIALGAVVLDLV